MFEISLLFVSQTGVVWHLAGWIGGKVQRISLKYYAVQDSDSEDIVIHFTDVM